MMFVVFIMITIYIPYPKLLLYPGNMQTNVVIYQMNITSGICWSLLLGTETLSKYKKHTNKGTMVSKWAPEKLTTIDYHLVMNFPITKYKTIQECLKAAEEAKKEVGQTCHNHVWYGCLYEGTCVAKPCTLQEPHHSSRTFPSKITVMKMLGNKWLFLALKKFSLAIVLLWAYCKVKVWFDYTEWCWKHLKGCYLITMITWTTPLHL